MRAGSGRYTFLILLLVLSFAYWISGAVSVIGDLRFGQDRARAPFDLDFRMQAISRIQPEAGQAGVHVGDSLLEFDGRPFTGYQVMRDAVRSARPGSLMRAIIERHDGTTAPIVIRLAQQSAEAASISEWLSTIALELAFPLFCLILGFWVAGVRPYDRNAWLLLGIMISLEFMLPGGNWSEPWQVRCELWSALAGYSWPVWMMLFGIYFPERSPMDRRFPWFKWLILCLAGLSSLTVLVFDLGKEISLASVLWLRPVMSPVDTVRKVMAMAAISLFFASLGHKAARHPLKMSADVSAWCA